MSQRKVIEINSKSNVYRNSPKRLKKKIKNFFFSLFIFIVVMMIFYFASPLSRLSVIYFNELEFVSRSTLVDLTKLTENELFVNINLREIESKLESHSLVESATVRRKGINSLMVQIEEKKIVGCVDVNGELMYVLNDGETISEGEGVNIVCQGIIIYGLTQSELEESILSLFVNALADVNPVFVSLINEIEYNPRFGDVNRFSLSLKDGNTVHVNSYTMVKRLEAYQTMVKRVADRLGEGVTGIFNLDVGLFFQPYSTTENVDLDDLDIADESNEMEIDVSEDTPIEGIEVADESGDELE